MTNNIIISIYVYISINVIEIKNIINNSKTIYNNNSMVYVMSEGKTTIQLTEATRDRLYKLKFRRTYDQFLNELCDLYEAEEKKNLEN